MAAADLVHRQAGGPAGLRLQSAEALLERGQRRPLAEQLRLDGAQLVEGGGGGDAPPGPRPRCAVMSSIISLRACRSTFGRPIGSRAALTGSRRLDEPPLAGGLEQHDGPGHGGVQRLDPRLERDGEEEVGRGHHLGGRPWASDPTSTATGPVRSTGLGAPAPTGDGGHQAPPAGPQRVERGADLGGLGHGQTQTATRPRPGPPWGRRGRRQAPANTTPDAPAASAARTSVPALPGSATSTRTSTGPAPIAACPSDRRSRSAGRRGATATRPCGLTVSVTLASAPGGSDQTGVPAAAAATTASWSGDRARHRTRRRRPRTRRRARHRRPGPHGSAPAPRSRRHPRPDAPYGAPRGAVGR